MIKLQYVGNSAESFKNGVSVDPKETCGITNMNKLYDVDSETTEVSEEWFCKKILGNYNHILCDDAQYYTFGYHFV
jgi:hypothetical protein